MPETHSCNRSGSSVEMLSENSASVTELTAVVSGRPGFCSPLRWTLWEQKLYVCQVEYLNNGYPPTERIFPSSRTTITGNETFGRRQFVTGAVTVGATLSLAGCVAGPQQSGGQRRSSAIRPTQVLPRLGRVKDGVRDWHVHPLGRKERGVTRNNCDGSRELPKRAI